MADNARFDLERRIEAAEARVLAGDERVRARWQALRQRVKRTDKPRGRWAARLARSAFALGALWWLSGRRPGKRVRPGEAAPPAPARRALPWAELIAIAWPLLPLRWRSKANPATVVALASVAVSVAGALRPANRPRRRADARRV